MEDEEFKFEEWDKEEGFDPFVSIPLAIVVFGSLIYLIVENGFFEGLLWWLILFVIIVPAIFKAFSD